MLAEITKVILYFDPGLQLIHLYFNIFLFQSLVSCNDPTIISLNSRLHPYLVDFPSFRAKLCKHAKKG